MKGLGIKSEARDDWSRYVGPAKAPGNYKKPDAIAKYLEEAELRQASEACGNLVTMMVTEVAVCSDAQGECERFSLFQYKNSLEFSRAVLAALFPPSSTVGYLTFDKSKLTSIVLDSITDTDPSTWASNCLIVPYWSVTKNCFDPSMGVDDPQLLCRRLGMPEFAEASVEVKKARQAFALGKKLGYPIYVA